MFGTTVTLEKTEQKKIICGLCKKEIALWQHYFYIQSNHPENKESWNTVEKYFHAWCLEYFDIYKNFEWHIKGQF